MTTATIALCGLALAAIIATVACDARFHATGRIEWDDRALATWRLAYVLSAIAAASALVALRSAW